MAESTNMDENDGRYQGILGTELPAVTDPRGLHGAPSPSAPRQGRLWNGRFHALDMDDDTHGDTLSIDLGFGIQEPSRKNMFASWYDASQNYHGTCTKNCDGKWCWKMNHGLEVVVAICVFHALLSYGSITFIPYMWVVGSSWIYCVNRFQLCIKKGNHPLRLSSAQLFHPLHLLQVIHRVDIRGPGCRLAHRTSSAALARGWVQLRDLWGDFWVTSFLLKVRRPFMIRI